MSGGWLVTLAVLAVAGSSVTLGSAVGAWLKYQRTGSIIAKRDSIFAFIAWFGVTFFLVRLLTGGLS